MEAIRVKTDRFKTVCYILIWFCECVPVETGLLIFVHRVRSSSHTHTQSGESFEFSRHGDQISFACRYIVVLSSQDQIPILHLLVFFLFNSPVSKTREYNNSSKFLVRHELLSGHIPSCWDSSNPLKSFAFLSNLLPVGKLTSPFFFPRLRNVNLRFVKSSTGKWIE